MAVFPTSATRRSADVSSAAVGRSRPIAGIGRRPRTADDCGRDARAPRSAERNQSFGVRTHSNAALSAK